MRGLSNAGDTEQTMKLPDTVPASFSPGFLSLLLSLLLFAGCGGKQDDPL